MKVLRYPPLAALPRCVRNAAGDLPNPDVLVELGVARYWALYNGDGNRRGGADMRYQLLRRRAMRRAPLPRVAGALSGYRAVQAALLAGGAA